MQTNKGGRDLIELVLFDPATGREEKVESDPLGKVDFGGAAFSDLTDELLYTTYTDDKDRVYFRDKAWEADYRLVKSKLPGKAIAFGGSTANEQLVMVTAYSDKDPGSRYLFDRRTKKLSLEYASRERIPRDQMAAMSPIRYKSSDGLEIPAYLTLPKGLPGKNLPLLVVPHGGPWARDTWGFNNLHQFMANRGYAVLSMNFRGSTGFGKKFLNAGNKQWGDRMQDDITWGVKHLVKTGVADPKRVGGDTPPLPAWPSRRTSTPPRWTSSAPPTC
jgi:dipeptidyl aminopeptidase/acylaminoacyl peptidase